MVKKKIKKFNYEFRKAFATAIVAAFGFITALAWRDVINEYLIEKVTSLTPFQGKLISAIIITIVAVIVIILASKWISESEEKIKKK